MIAVAKRPRPALRGVSPNLVADAFFQCPRCAGDLKRSGPDALLCGNCQHKVSAADGIVDFVAGASATALDNIDYDAYYGINAEHSLELYYVLRRAAGARWPAEFGDALEIGCGTGGLSLALLSRIKADQIVLTDISPKMLRICRERLRRGIPDRSATLAFATYSGVEHGFRKDAFGACFGTAVVHHITDVPLFLKQIFDLLKPGGFAFFMEPNRAFHRALTSTLAEIIAVFVRDGTVDNDQIIRMLNWCAEVHCSIVNSGDVEVLAEREDKHYFRGDAFVDWARDAGFGDAVALPCDLDPTGWGTLQNYLQQGGVSPAGFAALAQAWPLHYSRHFAALEPADQSPSYLFWLRKTARRRTGRRTKPTPSIAPVARKAPVELWLQLTANPSREDLEISVNGWCVADIPVASLQITAGDLRKRIPIWRSRIDIQSVINAKGVYPPLNALCSGIEGTVRLPPRTDGETILDLSFQVISMDGQIVEAGSATLDTATETSRTVHESIKP